MKQKHFFALSLVAFATIFFGCMADGTDTIVLLWRSSSSVEESSSSMPSSSSSVEESSSSMPSSSSSVEPSSSSAEASSSSICDINDYKIVPIDDKIWMAENLNCDVPTSRCYQDDPDNCDKYGRLYNWITAMNLPDSCRRYLCTQPSEKYQGICPDGWHIPNNEEWNALAKYANPSCSIYGYCRDSGKLKATSGWNDKEDGSSGNGEDAYGFAALPGGRRGEQPGFIGIGNRGSWWSSGEPNSISANYWSIFTNDEFFITDWDKFNSMSSVRCVKD